MEVAGVKFKLKELNQKNWLEVDELTTKFIKNSSAGLLLPIRSEEWLIRFLTPKLLKSVPQDVQDLFEVARGALLYGYFFYPLYSLGAEQLNRVAEAAISEKCKALGAPNPKKIFSKKIKWLADKGIISRADELDWDALRQLRNSASHPGFQSIIPPMWALGRLEKLTEKINALFNPV